MYNGSWRNCQTNSYCRFLTVYICMYLVNRLRVYATVGVRAVNHLIRTTGISTKGFYQYLKMGRSGRRVSKRLS